jgi:hypothetical protein
LARPVVPEAYRISAGSPAFTAVHLYDRRRAHGDRHAAALRNVFNRSLGQLWHCLQTNQLYDPTKAFPTPDQPTGQAGAA